MLRVFRSARAHALQSTRGRGSHACHIKVNSAVTVEIRKCMAHAKTVTILAQLRGDVLEVAATVVVVNVQAGKIIDDYQIQVAVFIQIDQ